MSGLNVVFRDLDQQRVRYQAMVHRVGGQAASLAFARAMNHEGRKGHTAVKKTLRKETSIKIAHINKAVSFHTASPKTLKTVIKGYGSEIPLRYFGAKQFKYGVRARVWGKNQRFLGAFVVASKGGTVFKNIRTWNSKSKRNNQIEKLFGPSIPKEMMRDAIVNAFMGTTSNVADRAMHELSRILTVH